MLENIDADLTYEDFPYPGMTFRETHPDSIATVASFYGLETQSPENCRVLELGCGNGSNLLWMASGLPNSEFVGIDLSNNHIIEARETLAGLGLKNAAFEQQDVLEIDYETYGKFDYVIAHGLFSWVPEAVSEKVLELYGKLLNPNGVGYISYNVLPGFHLRQIMRESMQYHLRNTFGGSETVKRARTFAQFLSETEQAAPLYNYLLKSEFDGMIERDDSVIFHDDLSIFNSAFYFSDFIGRAAKYELQFLSESERLTSLPNQLPPEISQFIEDNSENVIESEQYIDLIKGTNFRRTLLCRDKVVLNREFDPNIIKTFFVSSPLRPAAAETAEGDQNPEKFTTDSGSNFETDHILTRAVLACFKTNEHHEIPFEELISGARDDLIQNGFTCDNWEKEIETTVSLLIDLYSSQLVRFHICRSAALNYLTEKPRVSDYVRLRAQKGERVANSQGLNLVLSDDFTRELFVLLTGDRTRDDLVAALVSKLYDEKVNDIGIEEFTDKISGMVDKALEWMVRVGFLV